ncbi:HAMP domain-containing sensor histidine kinase [Streptomyces sp. HUAS MG47]|uniref:sensor histidine kinase n=1 Tax=Streptomyces solicamelliae TaxID=3231716 RepID=UPI00387802BC
MRKKLLLTYLSLTVVILLMLEIPLALSYSLNAYHHLATMRTRDGEDLAKEAARVSEGEITARQFEERIRTFDRQHQTVVVLIDPSGRVAAASRTDVTAAAAALDSAMAAALRGKSTRPERYSSYTLYPGEVVVAEPVTRGEKVVAALGLVASTAAIQDAIDSHTLVLLAVAVLALTAVALAGVPLTRWLLRPIRQLEKTAQAITEGAYEERVRCAQGPPEIRGMAEVFNRMADRLVTLLETQRAFVADASHQMRNPLTALRLRVESLESGVRPEAGKQLQQAIAEVERLSTLLDQLLRLARAEGPGQAVAPVEVRTVVAGRLLAWEEAASRKGVRLLAPDTEGPVSASVPGHLEQILDVLIDNALHVSGPGTVIEIRHEIEGRRARIRVIDQGPGMSEEDCGRALDRFWRGEEAARREGSGLGLAIAGTLAQVNNGSLRLLPVSPHGIEGTVTLPLCPRSRHGAGDPAALPVCPRKERV